MMRRAHPKRNSREAHETVSMPSTNEALQALRSLLEGIGDNGEVSKHTQVVVEASRDPSLVRKVTEDRVLQV